MNLRIATYPFPFLANCCKALGVSAFGVATPPCKSLIYNVLCSAGCFLAQIFFFLTQTNIFVSRRLRRKRRDLFRSHTESTDYTDSRRFLWSHTDRTNLAKLAASFHSQQVGCAERTRRMAARAKRLALCEICEICVRK